jgi:hypothetical protein
LICRDCGRALVDTIVLAVVLAVAEVLLAPELVDAVEDGASLGSVLVVVVGQNLAVCRDRVAILRRVKAFLQERQGAHLNHNNVAGDDIASLEFVFLTVADDDRAEGDARLELLDNVASGLFLVPADKGVL